MTRKKKPYIPPRPAPTPSAAPGDVRMGPVNRAVSINLDAMTGRADVSAGQRVRITAGLYEGEVGTVEAIVSGVIPAAVVRTADGRSRRVRTIDLSPES